MSPERIGEPSPDDPWCIRCSKVITAANRTPSRLLRWCLCRHCRTPYENGEVPNEPCPECNGTGIKKRRTG